ncbi:uncharacterized protein LOC131688491 [Topomyia yanbarensis]|uniref:uncharacterized protein LOC131688491 n=1 Tax=Topomyia yanbarensis TaxID=2498891 RepID=UPI00273A9560|nr:uncharacterized protein LOC131688491 [Topomyia yanbarensis]
MFLLDIERSLNRFNYSRTISQQKIINAIIFVKNVVYISAVTTKSYVTFALSTKLFFVTFDFASQLKSSLLQHWSIVQDYKKRCKDDIHIEDVLHGNVLRTIDGYSTNDVSLTFNTDGVAIFNSNAKKSLWPIIVTINELPPNLRYSRKNVLIAGLWLSNSEPDLDIFMRPFFEQLRRLAKEGLQLASGITCKVFTVCCCVDSIARCKIQQLKQFNGYEGCSFCKHEGTLTETKQIRYKYDKNILPRTQKDILNAMALFRNRGECVSGIKGISPLITLPKFDIVNYCPVDYMHCVLLGVCKQLARLWLEATNLDCYIKPHLEHIDTILESINPFYECSRSPRKLSERKTWKANEWQNWLFVYSCFCLKDVLPMKYYDHYCILIANVRTLLCNLLNDSVIQQCEINFQKFVQEFEILYGLEHMTYNVHLLLHLANCTRNFGPLWAFSLFIFEDINGLLKRYIKGPKDPILQIAMRCVMAHKRYNLNGFTQCQEKVQMFCKALSMHNRTNTIKSKHPIQIPEVLSNQYSKQSFFVQNNIFYNRFFFQPDRIPEVAGKRKRSDSTFSITANGKKYLWYSKTNIAG